VLVFFAFALRAGFFAAGLAGFFGAAFFGAAGFFGAAFQPVRA
jgi:hypothetical protein